MSKILHVNLSTGETRIEEYAATGETNNYLGGLGLGAKILYDHVGPEISPLDDNNALVVAAGALCGTAAPTSSRTHVLTKSPLTGIIGMGNFGGSFGPRLRFCGLDAIVVTGRSEDPVYLSLENGKATLNDARYLWGMDTWETTDALRGVLGKDASVLAIGQAGENLVKFSCPVADYHHAPGRSHTGSIMGSKKLKAITVRGSAQQPAYDQEGFKKAVAELNSRIINYPDKGARQLVGSHSSNVSARAKSGSICTGNFAGNDLPKDSDLYDLPDSFARHVSKGDSYCHQCLMGKYYGCDLVANVKKDPYKTEDLQGVSFSYIGSVWGGFYGIKRYPAIFKCREMCQRYGMDQAGPIIFAIELMEQGVITEKDTDGLQLVSGNHQAILEMLRKIAYREGFGNILAEGTAGAGKLIGRGAEKYASTIKNHQLLTSYPWGYPIAQQLGMAVCPRGGDDLYGTHTISDIEAFPSWASAVGWTKEGYFSWLFEHIDMFDEVKDAVFESPPNIAVFDKDYTANKAMLNVWFENLLAVINSLGLCLFAGTVWFALGPTHCANLYSSYTGNATSPREIMKIGERIFNLIKLYNVREGLTRKDDHYKERFYKEPAPRGSARGKTIDKDLINRLLDDYYELRGWDRVTGIPTDGKLSEMGLLELIRNE